MKIQVNFILNKYAVDGCLLIILWEFPWKLNMSVYIPGWPMLYILIDGFGSYFIQSDSWIQGIQLISSWIPCESNLWPWCCWVATCSVWLELQKYTTTTTFYSTNISLSFVGCLLRLVHLCDKAANVTNICIFKELAMHFNNLASKFGGSAVYTLLFKSFETLHFLWN